MTSRRINLALQGGGAHGAFTWGVLETILADPEIEIAGISATSAGALNAAALKAGFVENGRAGAIENLQWLWEQIGAVTDASFAPWLAAFGASTDFWAKALEYSPAYQALDLSARVMSPYAMGNVWANPLSRIVERFDFDRVCDHVGPEIHICATNVRSGKVRVFAGDEISSDAILASACLPNLFKAVEMLDPRTGEIEAFWDGGYTGNPALFPLFASHLPDDIVVVNINPLHRDELPTEPQAIANRVNEISFNSSLLRELRAIEFVKRLIDEGTVDRGRMKDVFVHMIADDALMNTLNVATKIMPSPVILSRLRVAGQTAAQQFLDLHRAEIGQNSTVDLKAMFN